MAKDLVIGLDASTTATKAIAWTGQGSAVGEGRAATRLSNPQPGWFEQEVSDWTGACAKALKQLSKKIDMARVAAVAISNQRESFAQFDGNNLALRPATLWLDERAHAETKELAAALGPEFLHEMSGKPSDVTPCITRCMWLGKHRPKIWNSTAMTAEVHGVLTHFLTGQWHTSTASADPMGLLNMRKYDWSDELIGHVGLSRQQLPKLFRPGQVMGEVLPNAAKVTGLKTGTLVVAGGGDGQCAGTGANVFSKGRAYLNLGTAAVSGNFGKAYKFDPMFRTLSAVSEEGYIFETCIRTGAFLLNWMVERMFHVDPVKHPEIFTMLEEEAKLSPIGSRGLALIPYWSGSMTPYWDPGAKGVIAGLSGSHTRGDVYRALLEGIVLEQVMLSNGAAAATETIDHYVVMGGGAKSDFWCQMMADASGRDVKRLETLEASSLGAAIAAAKGAGWFKSIPQAAGNMSSKPSKIFRPRMKHHKSYSELLTIYRDLWPQMAQWNARMQDFNRTQNG